MIPILLLASFAQEFVHVKPADLDRLRASGQIVASGGGLVRLGSRIAPFAAKDLKGGEWTEKSLQGKTTFISLWAAWCKPCVDELPIVERLRTAASELADVQVISFNVDEPEAKMPDRDYKIPVILIGAAYVKKMVEFDKFPLPKFWIVNRDGVIVREMNGRISGDPDWWIGDQLRLLQRK